MTGQDLTCIGMTGLTCIGMTGLGLTCVGMLKTCHSLMTCDLTAMCCSR